MVLAAEFAAIRGIGAGILATFGRLGEAGINQSAAPVDPVGAIKFCQEHGMQLDPNAGLVPNLQVMSTRLAAAVAQVGRQIIPSNPRLKDKENAGENLAVVERFASGKAEATLG